MIKKKMLAIGMGCLISMASVIPAFAAEKIVKDPIAKQVKIETKQTETLLKHFQQRTPQLYDFFSPLKTSHDGKEKQRLINAAYNRIPPINFSKLILEKISN